MLNTHCIECKIQKRDRECNYKIGDGVLGKVEAKDLGDNDEFFT